VPVIVVEMAVVLVVEMVVAVAPVVVVVEEQCNGNIISKS
jgi:hypothetical protein